MKKRFDFKLSDKTKYIITAVLMGLMAISFFVMIAIMTEGHSV